MSNFRILFLLSNDNDVCIERVLQYRRKYLTVDSFDNKYLTQELYDLDERKQILDRPTILPLTRVEKNKYIKVYEKIILILLPLYILAFGVRQ